MKSLIFSLISVLGLSVCEAALAADAKKGKGERQKFLTGEARGKKGSTEIDFDEADIEGRRRDPAGIAISKNRPDHEYDLINLRLRWHPEMIESTGTLETGKGR
ncbi:MAG: hypothetical protein AB7T49_17025 [Oligoflexales bacterium]